MTVKEAFQKTKRLQFSVSSHPVVENVARVIVNIFPGADLQPVEVKHFESAKEIFNIAVRSDDPLRKSKIEEIPNLKLQILEFEVCSLEFF